MRTPEPSWPMVGRAAELEVVAELLGAGRSVVVAGRAGVGKTSVARAALDAAAGAGWATGWVVASDATHTIPLGALAHLIPHDVLGQRPRPEELIAAISGTLRASRAEVGLVLGVDDAHLLDDASAALVRTLATSDEVTVLATLRTREPAPGAIAALWRDPTSARLELQELAEPELAEVLRAVLDGPIDRRTIHRLQVATGGNPLFLRELVRSLLGSGALAADGGWWRWDGQAQAGISAPGLIAERTAALGPAQRGALEVVALGEPLDLRVAESLADVDALAALEADELVEVADDHGPVLRAAHPLYAEAVRSSTPVTRARRIRRLLAAAVASRPDAGPDELLRAAVWRLDAGDAVEPWLCVTGARRAWVAGDVHLAERLARHAVEQGSPASPAAEARYLLGEALADRGLFEEAVAEWRRVDPGDDDQLRAVVALSLAQVIGLALKRPEEALALLDATLAGLEAGPTRDRVAGVRAVVLGWAGDRDEATAAAGALLDAGAEPEAELQALLATLPFELLALRTGGVAVALPRARAAAEACRESTPSGPMWLAVIAFFVELIDGRPDRAEALARAELEASLGHDRVVERAYFTEALGLAAMEQGRLRAAADLLEEALPLHRRYDNGSLAGCLLELAVARAMAGDAAGAASAHDEAVALDRQSPFGFIAAGRARGWVLAAAGELSEARSVLRSAASQARADGAALHELLALRDAARLGDARAVRDRVAELDHDGASPHVTAVRALVDGLASGDGERLAAAAAAFESGGTTLLAAECWRAAAQAEARAGRSEAAHRADRRARHLLDRCEAPVTPLLAGGALADPLTPREREVAGLVGRGLPDREVAERLGLSVRTVHAHLRSTYTKLGLAGRHQLAERTARRHD